jgi:hypothetical protein
MRELSWLVPVLIVAAVMASKAFQTWVRAKHGYPMEESRRSRRGQPAKAIWRPIARSPCSPRRMSG